MRKLLLHLTCWFGSARVSIFAILSIALLIHPLSLSSHLPAEHPAQAGNSFSLSLDVDGTAGDQGDTSLNVSPERVVSIQIFGSDLQGATGISPRFEYDASQVVYEGFEGGDVLPSALVLPGHGTNPTFVTISMVSSGGPATVNTGLVGTIRFRTSATFSGTTIRLVGAELGRGERVESVTLNVRVALQSGPSPDFDGDGMVGFTDFLQFADKFGSSQGDGKYEARFDLDGDGSIGFSDFLEFASQFGKKVPSRLKADREALVALYNATDGDNWTDKTNWLTDSDLSTWFGVTVLNGRVTELDLGENNLTGEVPPQLGNLSGLTVLSLGRNALSGSMLPFSPRQLSGNALSGAIPVELGNLSNLEVLNFSGNALSGSIPAFLGNLANLEVLNFSGNALSGAIPVELGNLANLRQLNLGGNALGGSIPSFLGNLSNLEVLNLYRTRLSGAIPVELGNLSNLRVLSLGRNALSGSIPVELGNMTNLEVLNLDWNRLSGVIPVELGNLSNLTWLGLARNESGGSIPSFLGNMTNLEVLNLNSNALSGSIPSFLGNLSNLERLTLSNNALSGSIPSFLGNLSNLDCSGAQWECVEWFDSCGIGQPVQP